MSRAKLVASRLLWRGREIKAYRHWQWARRTYQPNDPRRQDAYDAYAHASAQRKLRDRQLSSLEATHVDRAGRDFITRHEGKRNKPYNDSRGFCTTGVGHLIGQHACTMDDIRRWTLTDHEVDALLSKDLAVYEKAVRDVFKGANLKATQNRFNAAVSMAFNIGVGGFKSSTFAKLIRTGDLHGAADAMLKWNKPPEIMGRRRDERALFLK